MDFNEFGRSRTSMKIVVNCLNSLNFGTDLKVGGMYCSDVVCDAPSFGVIAYHEYTVVNGMLALPHLRGPYPMRRRISVRIG